MEKNNYISLLHKKLTGELNTVESDALHAWLNESNEHSSMAEDIQAAWALSERYQDTPQFNPSQGFSKFQQRLKADKVDSGAKVIRFMPRLMQVAAVFILLLSAWFVFQPSGNLEYHADQGVLFVSLEDGSEVWLNEGSSLAVSSDFNDSERKLSLSGEAFFDVARDESKTFIIGVEDAEIKVLGTAFNVDSDNEGIVLEVKEGLVEFSKGTEKVLVEASEKAVLVTDASIEKGTMDSKNNFSWVNNELSFQNTPMAQVFKELELYYNTTIELSEHLQLDCSFTSANMKDLSLEDVLKVIGVTFEIEYHITDNRNVKVSKFDCK